MADIVQRRSWISGILLGAESSALMLAVVLGQVVVATPSAEAQAPTSFKVLYAFKGGTDGGNPYAGLVRDAAGNLYSTAAYGTSGYGTVFKLDTTGTETVLYRFKGQPDGAYPEAGLIRDAAGLYGTTFEGGSGTSCVFTGCGTVFKVNTSGKETVLYNFTGGADGANPVASLVLDAAGNLYGTTEFGGNTTCIPYGCGVVFKLDTTGTETVLHAFTGGADGQYPLAGLVRDAAGNLYGTTSIGGDLGCNAQVGCGTVFKLDTTGTETVLYSFTGSPDGQYPYAGLVRDAAGNLYGTTKEGGSSNNCGGGCGTVFKLDTTGTETVLHSFTGAFGDGIWPLAGLVRDATGNLYGTTYSGGSFGNGTVFKLDTTGTETTLHSFSGFPDGFFPMAGLIFETSGNLYGTASEGGRPNYCSPSGCGTVFRITP